MQAILNKAIHSVRRRLRLALATETLLRLVVAAGMGWWGGMLLDWWLEPPATVRGGAWAVFAILVLGWLYRHSLSALLAPTPDRMIAGWIERSHPDLKGSLLTSLSTLDAADPVQAELVQQARRRAAQQLKHRDQFGVVDLSKLRPWMATASIVLASVLGWCAAYPHSAYVYTNRLLLGSQRWPRMVVLQVEGFDVDEFGQRTKRVAQGADLDLLVRAELTAGHRAPREVRARVQKANGERSRRVLAVVGQPTQGAQAHQAYRLALRSLKQDVQVRLRGGDGSLGPLWIRVAARPAITQLEVEVQPPAYLQQASYRQSVEAIQSIPVGSQIMLHGKVSRPVHAVQAMQTVEEEQRQLPCVLAESGDTFQIDVTEVTQDTSLAIQVADRHSIQSDPPLQVTLLAQPDEAPQIALSLTGIGSVITADAVIPLHIQVNDDYALQTATLHMQANQQSRQEALLTNPENQGKFNQVHLLDLIALRANATEGWQAMRPGDTLQIVLSASDGYNLGEPHLAQSQAIHLTVVTPDELVALLEENERNLRQTFQQVYDEARGAQLLTESLAEASANDPAEKRELGLQRLESRLAKVADETNAVAEGFRAIRDELSNNRVANDDLRDRIEYRIILPLEILVKTTLPELAAELQHVGSMPAASFAVVGPRMKELLQQMDAALKEMKSVESYNEVLALLRGIIQEQRDLGQKTDNVRRSSLKRLLFD